MGEEITLIGVEMINGGSLQVDIYFQDQKKGARFFCEAEQFFSMLGKSMTECNNAFEKKWAEDNGMIPEKTELPPANDGEAVEKAG